MQVLINSDHSIDVSEALGTYVHDTVENTLSRFSEHITRVEIHLSDENGPKIGSHDKRCMMEARLKKSQPIAVTHQATTLDHAIDGALDKLARLIENTQGRKRDGKNHRAIHRPAEPNPS